MYILYELLSVKLNLLQKNGYIYDSYIIMKYSAQK